MSRFSLRVVIILLILLININICLAKQSVKILADVEENFTAKNQDLPEKIYFKTIKANTIPDVISIPENSVITLEVMKAQRELRWHKSGIILCKLAEYLPEGMNTPINTSDKDIYLVVRKYEKINKKEAWILGTEIVVMQGASFFAPGVDIGYFFIKGAIQREKDPNWFKAGVHNAYDNSICWFWLKGKPIELESGHQVQIKDISKKKAEKLITKIDTRNARFERQAAKRIAKKDNKTLKRQLKNEKKLVDCSVVENAIENVVIDRSVLAEIVKTEKSAGNK